MAPRIAVACLCLFAVGCETRTPQEPPARTAAAPPPPEPTRAPLEPARPAESAAPPAEPTPSATVAPSPRTTAPPPSPAKARCNVALIGDSLTDFRAHGGGYVRYLERRCPGSHFENFAKGGAMVNQMRRTFEASVLRQPPGTFTHVLVFGGVNDLYSDETAGRTNDKIERDLAAMYAAARAHGARVVALTVAPWGGFARYFTPHRGETTRALNDWIRSRREAGTVDVVVDAFQLLACGDVFCDEYANARSDGLHFGKAGHEVLGRALWEAEFQNCS